MVVTLNSPELVGSGSAARSPERGVPLQLHTWRTPSSPTLSALAGSVGCVHTPNTVPVWPRSGWLHRGVLASNRFDAAARAAYHALHMPVLGGARERAAAKRGSPRVSVSHGESSLASAAKRLLHSPLRDSSAGVDSRFRTSTIHSSGSCESDGTGCCCASAGEAIAVTVVDTATRERGEDDTLKILCGKLRNISQTVLIPRAQALRDSVYRVVAASTSSPRAANTIHRVPLRYLPQAYLPARCRRSMEEDASFDVRRVTWTKEVRGAQHAEWRSSQFGNFLRRTRCSNSW